MKTELDTGLDAIMKIWDRQRAEEAATMCAKRRPSKEEIERALVIVKWFFACNSQTGACPLLDNEYWEKKLCALAEWIATLEGDIPDEPEKAEDMNSKPIGWVMVTERMPEPGLAVLVATYGGRLVAMDALFDNEVWIKSEDKDVTHWMPLPLPPNGKPQPKGQPHANPKQNPKNSPPHSSPDDRGRSSEDMRGLQRQRVQL